MRLISIDNLKEKMQVGKNVYSGDGHLLLAEGMPLTGEYINRLKELGITSIYILDKKIGKVEVDELVSEQTKIDALNVTREAMTGIAEGKSVNGEKISKVVNNVMEELILNRNLMVNLVDIRAMNDYTFSHCVCVCILSLITGIASGYDFHKLKQLGTGAILHDIGKAAVPSNIINKPAKLTPEEFAEVQKHTIYGFEILRKFNDISILSAHVAWQHHEKINGMGYPRGLKGEEIHEFARIVAIADVYDALTTDRIYRKKLMPHEVIEHFRRSTGKTYDAEFTRLFLQNIAPFPVGCLVLLSNEEKAVVIKTSKEFPARPVVKIIIDKDENLIAEPIDKDLTKDLSVFIIKAIKE